MNVNSFQWVVIFTLCVCVSVCQCECVRKRVRNFLLSSWWDDGRQRERKETNKKKRDYKYAIYVWKYIAYNRIWNLRVRVYRCQWCQCAGAHTDFWFIGLSDALNFKWGNGKWIFYIYIIYFMRWLLPQLSIQLSLWLTVMIALINCHRRMAEFRIYNECDPNEKRETCLLRRKTTNKINCPGFGRTKINKIKLRFRNKSTKIKSLNFSNSQTDATCYFQQR